MWRGGIEMQTLDASITSNLLPGMLEGVTALGAIVCIVIYTVALRADVAPVNEGRSQRRFLRAVLVFGAVVVLEGIPWCIGQTQAGARYFDMNSRLQPAMLMVGLVAAISGSIWTTQTTPSRRRESNLLPRGFIRLCVRVSCAGCSFSFISGAMSAAQAHPSPKLFLT